MVERRRYPRFELKVEAKYRPVSSEDVFKPGKTRNISAEGICFESDEEFHKGSNVTLEMDLKDNQPPITLVGEVVWSKEVKVGLKQKKYVNGVKLVDVDKSDEGRFLKFYCDRMVEKLSGYL